MNINQREESSLLWVYLCWRKFMRLSCRMEGFHKTNKLGVPNCENFRSSLLIFILTIFQILLRKSSRVYISMYLGHHALSKDRMRVMQPPEIQDVFNTLSPALLKVSADYDNLNHCLSKRKAKIHVWRGETTTSSAPTDWAKMTTNNFLCQ